MTFDDDDDVDDDDDDDEMNIIWCLFAAGCNIACVIHLLHVFFTLDVNI